MQFRTLLFATVQLIFALRKPSIITDSYGTKFARFAQAKRPTRVCFTFGDAKIKSLGKRLVLCMSRTTRLFLLYSIDFVDFFCDYTPFTIALGSHLFRLCIFQNGLIIFQQKTWKKVRSLIFLLRTVETSFPEKSRT